MSKIRKKSVLITLCVACGILTALMNNIYEADRSSLMLSNVEAISLGSDFPSSGYLLWKNTHIQYMEIDSVSHTYKVVPGVFKGESEGTLVMNDKQAKEMKENGFKYTYSHAHDYKQCAEKL